MKVRAALALQSSLSCAPCAGARARKHGNQHRPWGGRGGCSSPCNAQWGRQRASTHAHAPAHTGPTCPSAARTKHARSSQASSAALAPAHTIEGGSCTSKPSARPATTASLGRQRAGTHCVCTCACACSAHACACSARECACTHLSRIFCSSTSGRRVALALPRGRATVAMSCRPHRRTLQPGWAGAAPGAGTARCIAHAQCAARAV